MLRMLDLFAGIGGAYFVRNQRGGGRNAWLT